MVGAGTPAVVGTIGQWAEPLPDCRGTSHCSAEKSKLLSELAIMLKIGGCIFCKRIALAYIFLVAYTIKK